MKKADYISKSAKGDPELEFVNLRDTGLAEIQRLAGSTWTDYNVHDPGVTILEQLCFAITELGYKTNFDITDLFASQHDTSRLSDTFYTPARILQGKPITITDFRKILIDRVDNLRDVWIEPMNLSSSKNEIKGTYAVMIKPAPLKNKKKEERVKIRKKIVKDTRQRLEEYSNIGEAFDEIILLKEEEIYVSANIELDNEANAEYVHAAVTYEIQQFISKPIPFYSLKEMQDAGFISDEIFDGPRLNNGFIKDEDLKNKITTLQSSLLIDRIYRVPGISKVKELKLQKAEKDEKREIVSFQYQIGKSDNAAVAGSVMDDGVLIDLNKVAVMADGMLPYNRNYKPYITYSQNRVPIEPFKNNVIRYLRQIENENRVKYNHIYQGVNDNFPVYGTEKPIENYYSVQEHFPEIYGLGSRGIPPSLEPKHVAQIKQLKAYLLLFEQIFTNYLGQLSNFSKLFSLDEDLKQTYFAGSLSSIPLINDLVLGLDNKKTMDEVDQITKKISCITLREIDDFDERRHQVLDHLLARFGEHMSSFGISKFNYYYSQKDHKKRMIDAKIKMLKELVYVSSKRAKSFNALKVYWADGEKNDKSENKPYVENISYVEKKARIKLGIQAQTKKITTVLRKYIGEEWKQARILTPRILYKQIDKKHRTHDELTLNSVLVFHSKQENFDPGIEIDNEILRRGIWPDNYKIITDDNKKETNIILFSRRLPFNALDTNKQEKVLENLKKATDDLEEKPEYIRFWNTSINGSPLLLEFHNPGDGIYLPIPSNVWVAIKEWKTRDDAFEYTSNLIKYLQQVNIDTEGIYLVDHIELRPRKKENKYGIILKDHNKQTAFVSEMQYTYVEMQQALIKLISNAREATFVHGKTASDEETTILKYKGQTIGYYRNLSDVKLSSEEREDSLKKLFKNLTDFDLYDPDIITFYKGSEKDEEKTDGRFYSFRTSILVPSWPSRFADLEFRKVVESTIREDMPAHIGVQFFYLDFDELERFEGLYSKWLDELRKHDREQLDAVNKSAKDVTKFIQHLEKNKK